MVALTAVSAVSRSVGRTCGHLMPIERALASAGVSVGSGVPCPHDPDWGRWHVVDVVFDVRRLRQRVALDPCVEYEEFDGRLAPSDATFYCTCCKVAVVGRHPRSAPVGTPRVG